MALLPSGRLSQLCLGVDPFNDGIKVIQYNCKLSQHGRFSFHIDVYCLARLSSESTSLNPTVPNSCTCCTAAFLVFSLDDVSKGTLHVDRAHQIMS